MLTVILSERSESKDLGGWESVRKTPTQILRLGRFAPSLRMTEWVALVAQASRLHVDRRTKNKERRSPTHPGRGGRC